MHAISVQLLASLLRVIIASVSTLIISAQNGPCRKTFELEYPEIFITPVAGLMFETKNRAIFSGELFSGEELLEQHYCPYNFVHINVCGVDSFSPN